MSKGRRRNNHRVKIELFECFLQTQEALRDSKLIRHRLQSVGHGINDADDKRIGGETDQGVGVHLACSPGPHKANPHLCSHVIFSWYAARAAAKTRDVWLNSRCQSIYCCTSGL